MSDYYCPKCKNRMVHSGHSTERFQDKIETRTEYVCPNCGRILLVND